jgi:hypothetical protein
MVVVVVVVVAVVHCWTAPVSIPDFRISVLHASKMNSLSFAAAVLPINVWVTPTKI